MTHLRARFSSPNSRFQRQFAARLHLIFALAGSAFCLPLQANTITVDDASSGSVAGKCTIQDAVKAANTNAAVQGCTAGSVGLDTIHFAAAITNIALTAPMTAPAGSVSANCVYGLAVSEDLIIDAAPVAGSGVPKVAIQRSAGAATNFGVIGASIYDCGVVPGTTLKLTLSGLTIGNGNLGGLFNGNGGGVTSDFLTINDSVISSNNAANSGGGMYAYTSLSMNTSTVNNNKAKFLGGGIQGVTLTIYGSTINGNSAGTGGGLLADLAVVITNSTVSGNSAGQGSGIDTPSLQSTWVTITANTGAGQNGGLGWYLENGGQPSSLSHTVIAGNLPGNSSFAHDFDTSSAITVGGDHSWIGTMNATAQNDLANGVLIASCPTLGLGPLANNGGGTQTHALVPGSCLIDAGGTTTPIPGIVYDQRGMGFARFVNTHSDIGAFEYQGGPAPVNGACGADNGQTLLAAPTNLCSAGTPSAVTGTGHPWSWTCASTSGGTTAACSATIKTWTVSASATSGGAVSPATQTVDNGATAAVTVSPASGYLIASVTGCGGALNGNGNSYTTAAVVADCAISAVFSIVPVIAAPPVAAPFLSQFMLAMLTLALLAIAVVAPRKRRRA